MSDVTAASLAPLVAELQAHASAKRDDAHVATAQRIADLASGVADPAVFALRTMALIEITNVERRRGRFDAAEAAAALLCAHTVPSSRSHADAQYLLGLARRDREDDPGSIAPLAEASAGYVVHDGAAARTTGLARAAWGLALLRSARWHEAAVALRLALLSMRAQPATPNDLASVLHNLAIALERGGAAEAALVPIEEALALRRTSAGAGHPLTVETMIEKARALVALDRSDEARALLEAGAGAVLRGGGEAHPFFAEAMLVEARRRARLAEGLKADALTRRALHLLRGPGASGAMMREKEGDAYAVRKLWREDRRLDASGPRALVEVTIDHTLQRWSPAKLDFDPSGTRPKVWYVELPAAWVVDVDAMRRVVHGIFADVNAGLSAREPADANYLDAVSWQTRSLGDDDMLSIPWVERCRARVWEPSIAWIARPDRSAPLAPAELATLVHAHLFLQRRIDQAALASKLAAFGITAAAAARIASDPLAAIAAVRNAS